MPTQTFRQVTVVGDARQRGLSHGEQLADRIVSTIDFYRALLPGSEEALLAAGGRVRDHLQSLTPGVGSDFVAELDAIGEAIHRIHGVDPRWPYVLNARTELLRFGVNECTALYFGKTGCLGQNWDWAQQLETLIVFMTIVPDNGPTIWMLTEPGIIGKIGMNSAGVGACLNILRCRGTSSRAAGLPVHLALRAVLNSQSVNNARETITAHQLNTASNILVGDDSGACFDVEFAGQEQHWLPCDGAAILHTNHYCVDGVPLNDPNAEMRCSRSRYARGEELLKNLSAYDLAEMDAILSDRSGELPINRDYAPDEDAPSHVMLGTVATLLMDLRKRKLYLRRGAKRPDQDLIEMPI